MPEGNKDKYSEEQKRKAEHIEKSYEDKGVSEKEAEARAWATVNKQDGGGEKGGSGEDKSETEKKHDRSDSAKNAAATRKRKSKAK
jgi:plasmid stabilization system protein ParE